MAATVVEQPLNQLSHNFENLKIDVHRNAGDTAEFPVSNPQFYPSFIGETFHSNASVASSEMIGDGASSYCSREEYPELTYITTPNGYAPSYGTLYTGCTSPVMNAQGYVPYQMDMLHYYNPGQTLQMVDYNYTSQPVYGSVPTGMQYPPQVNDGFVYGPQVYQFPLHQYYQQPPLGQCVQATPPMPTGGMVLLEPQEPSDVIPNGFHGYPGHVPVEAPMTFVPPVACENPLLPVTMSYPPLPATHPTHTLRASAPAWIEPPHDLKGSFKEHKPVESHSAPQLNTLYAPNKVVSTVPSNGIMSKGNANFVAVKAAAGTLPGSAPLMTHCAGDAKESAGLVVDKSPKRENALLNQVLNPMDTQAHENGVQAKGHQFVLAQKPAKPLTVLSIKEACPCLPNGERYNSEDFVTKYEDAKHFIIKSYSEENVFRSIQYGVWASTPNGNKKLDDAYHDAQRRASGRSHGCPIFLFFSVNGSRQFCGIAEMMGPVDYKRSMEFWEQHKWSGSFPLKWHFIKDVPNSQFRRIILQNNENKPVTNSRDTQEVYFQQGLEMLSIIKSYPARTSILDEFPLCNMPIKAVPELKPQHNWSPQSFPKIGEQIGKLRGDEPDAKSPKLASTALNVCDNGAKITLAKPVVVKALPVVGGQEPALDKERRMADKENIKVAAGKEGGTVAV